MPGHGPGTVPFPLMIALLAAGLPAIPARAADPIEWAGTRNEHRRPVRGWSIQPPGDPLGNRDRDHREQALEKHGGNRETERAVAAGLEWLAAHQQPNGVWERKSFDRLCPGNDRCSQTALKRMTRDLDVGVSALAALAFLGAGYTHEQGQYAQNLTRVLEFILAQQERDGSFSTGDSDQMYNDALATFAVAEAYAMTRDQVFAEPLARAVRHLERSQQQEGGWDYTADTRTRRSDTSITGWVLMALKSALAAGASPSIESRLRIIEHFDRATEPDGRVWYADRGTGAADSEPGRTILRYGPAMTAVGLYARSALGFRLDDDPAKRQIALLLNDRPDLRRLYNDPAELHNEYYWYYGTLAAFNAGGETWARWNASLRRTVLEYQERPVRKDGSRRHNYGSWPAFGRGWGKWGRSGSRIYSTAINTLTLEIYYRYEPAYLSPRGLIGPIELREQLAQRGTAGHRKLIELTKRLHADTAEPLLLEFLQSEDSEIRLDAALELVRLGSPSGEAELNLRRDAASEKTARAIKNALADIEAIPKAQEFGAVTEVSEAARMFLFDTRDRPLYYGQRVTIMRDGKPIAAARVNRRFSGKSSAAARLDEGQVIVAVGDRVMARRTEDAVGDG